MGQWRATISFVLFALCFCAGCTRQVPGFRGTFKTPTSGVRDPQEMLPSKQWEGPKSPDGKRVIVLEIKEESSMPVALFLIIKKPVGGKVTVTDRTDGAVEGWLLGPRNYDDIGDFSALSDLERSNNPNAARMAGTATIDVEHRDHYDVSVDLACPDPARAFVKGHFKNYVEFHPEYLFVAVFGLPYYLFTGKLPI